MLNNFKTQEGTWDIIKIGFFGFIVLYIGYSLYTSHISSKAAKLHLENETKVKDLLAEGKLKIESSSKPKPKNKSDES